MIASAASIADSHRFLALPYASKSPFASAAFPSLIALLALAIALARDELLDVPVLPVVVEPPEAVPELPENT